MMNSVLTTVPIEHSHFCMEHAPPIYRIELPMKKIMEETRKELKLQAARLSVYNVLN